MQDRNDYYDNSYRDSRLRLYSEGKNTYARDNLVTIAVLSEDR